MSGLNESQSAAVEAILGPARVVRVNAPAGTGKTYTLVEAVRRLADTRPEASILVATFTSVAAKEVRDRLFRAGVRRGRVDARTFHSLALRRLPKVSPQRHKWDHARRISSDSGPIRLANRGRLWRHLVVWAPGGTVPGTKIRCLRMDGMRGLAYAKAVERLRSLGLRTGEGYTETVKACQEIGLPNLYAAWCHYEEAKAALGLWDFGDALDAYLHALRTGRERERPDVVLVDEAQDQSPLQLWIARALSGHLEEEDEHRGKLVLVGHETQSIFSFQGADPRVFRSMGGVDVSLTVNYRSSSVITDLGREAEAAALGTDPIPVTSDRGDVADSEVHVILGHDLVDEANKAAHLCASLIKEGVKPQEIAILFRTHLAAALYEGTFPLYDIPVQHWGGKGFWAQQEAIHFLAYARLWSAEIGWSVHRLCLPEVANVPNRYIASKVREAMPGVEAHTVSGAIDKMIASDLATPSGQRALRQLRSEIRELQQLSWPSAAKWIRDRLRVHVAPNAAAKRGRGSADEDRAATPELLCHIAQRFDSGEDLYAYAVRANQHAKQETGGNAVTLSTVHRFKGLERRVVLVSCNEGVWPNPEWSFPKDEKGRNDYSEERRLMYVALTRARDRLYLLGSAYTMTGHPAVVPRLVRPIPTLNDLFNRAQRQMVGT